MRASGASTVVVAVALSLIMGAAAGFGGAWYYTQQQAAVGGEPAPPSDGPGGIEPRPTVQVMTDADAIVNAVEKADPAVVKIEATTVTQPQNPFEFFFGGPRVQKGMGSGFLFSYDGRTLVLTNAHVVGEAEEITVQTAEGHELKGRLLGMDRAFDVAVLELQGDVADLPAATLGNSDDVAIGEWVVAIGHPFAFDHTVTVGVVSAQGQRPIAGGNGDQMRNLIQTDAAINQGNSGGPLVNLAGEVIGINSMIFSPTGTSLGIGFAIPVNDVKLIVHYLMERGPWLGIERAMPNSAGLARHLGLGTEEGVVILGIARGGPADEAGVQPGDVILAIDGADVSDGEELRRAVFDHEIGDTLTMQIQRGGETMQIDVRAGQVPEDRYR